LSGESWHQRLVDDSVSALESTALREITGYLPKPGNTR
jgi:hypothetical protein